MRAVRNNYVFVTRQTHSSNFGSLQAADTICANAAAADGLPGTYIAWLSSSTTDATSAGRVGKAGGFVRIDGRPFAGTVASLKNGKIFYPIQLDPLGVQVDPTAFVFTGTYGLGTFGGNACVDWQERISRYAAVGYAFGGAGEWTNYDRVLDCTNSARLYCFGVDSAGSLALAPAPAVHRLAFLSKPFTPSGGRAAIDQRCQDEATTAGLATNGRTYRAWIATSDQAPSTPFSTSAALGGWYRIDGLPVFPDPTVLKNNDADSIAPDAPIAQRADGSYVRDVPQRDTSVWTGMNVGPNQPATGPGFTCNDWTTASGSSFARAGNAGFGNPLPFGSPPVRDTRATYAGGQDLNCSLQRSVYCLQQ